MCDREGCTSDRTVSVCAKCSDLCCIGVSDGDVQVERDGYVPKGLGIRADWRGQDQQALNCGDYVEFDYCLECGKIQGKFPIAHEAVRTAVKED